MGIDVLVVGNGMIGLSVAEALVLADPALQVVVVGPSDRTAGASRAAGAMLGCFGEVTKDTFATPQSRAKFALSAEAHRRWSARLEELSALATEAGEPFHRVEGTHVILNSRSGVLDSLNFEAITKALAEWHEPWEEIDPATVPALNPVTDSRPLRALSLPGEGAVDAQQVLRLLERKLAAAGVEFVDAAVEALTSDAGGLTGVQLADGSSIAATRVVVAAGARSGALLRSVLPVESVIPMYAGSGIAFVGRRVLGTPFTTVVRTPNRSGACGLHVVPLADDLEYFGATNVLFAEPETTPYLGVGNFVAQCAMEQLDRKVFFHRIDEWRMGNRPVTLDTFPVVGWAGMDGLYVVSGTYRDGFHCSEVLAELAAAEILGGPPPDLPFSPTRRPDSGLTVDGAIAEFVVHNLAGWFENDLRLPRYIGVEGLEEAFETRARKLHADLGIGFGLPPEIVMFLLDSRKDPAEADRLAAYVASIA